MSDLAAGLNLMNATRGASRPYQTIGSDKGPHIARVTSVR